MNPVHPLFLQYSMEKMLNEQKIQKEKNLKEERIEKSKLLFKDILYRHIFKHPDDIDYIQEYGYIDIPLKTRRYWFDKVYEENKDLIGENLQREGDSWRFTSDINEKQLHSAIMDLPGNLWALYRGNRDLAKEHEVEFLS
jgi:hypothetical protein